MAIEAERAYLVTRHMESGAMKLGTKEVEGIVLTPADPEQLKADEMPSLGVQIPPLAAIVKLTGGTKGESYTLRGFLIAPDGTEMPHTKLEHNIWGNERRRNHVIAIGTRITFSVPGEYHFRFLLNGQELADIPLNVIWEEVPKRD
jgi:hypothetical protein